MKKALSRIVSLLLVLCLVTALVPAVFAADENEVQILFLDTSDVHGQQFAKKLHRPPRGSKACPAPIIRA